MSEQLEYRTSEERMSRTFGITKSLTIDKEKDIDGLKEALHSLSTVRKRKNQFIQSIDSVKLSYRCYDPHQKGDVKAIFSK
jgi:hypothetical protein